MPNNQSRATTRRTVSPGRREAWNNYMSKGKSYNAYFEYLTNFGYRPQDIEWAVMNGNRFVPDFAGKTYRVVTKVSREQFNYHFEQFDFVQSHHDRLTLALVAAYAKNTTERKHLWYCYTTLGFDRLGNFIFRGIDIEFVGKAIESDADIHLIAEVAE